MKMRLDVFYVLFIGYFVEIGESGHHDGKHVHVKIHIPAYIHKHKHTHVKYIKPHHDKEDKKIIVIHKHEHKHDHGHKHGHKHGHDHDHKHDHGHKHGHHHKHEGKHDHHHGHKHKHDHKHKHEKDHYDHHDHHKPHHHAKIYPHVDEDYFDHHNDFSSAENSISGLPRVFANALPKITKDHKSHKHVKSHKYQVEEVKDSNANDPVNKYYVRGTYQVKETDPFDHTTTAYHKLFRAPIAKINLQQTGYGEPPAEESQNDNLAEGHENYDEENYEDYPDNEELKNYEDYAEVSATSLIVYPQKNVYSGRNNDYGNYVDNVIGASNNIASPIRPRNIETLRARLQG